MVADQVGDLLRRLAGWPGKPPRLISAGHDGDPDGTEQLLDLHIRQVGYRTALAITARVPQPSLADFLR